MTSLSDHHLSSFVKLCYIGDGGTGKTGSLVSLVEAGYKLRILDLDNGLDSLVGFCRKQCPDKMKNVDYETRRDVYKMTARGPEVKGTPKAFAEAMNLLDKWSDDTVPSEWGPDHILVVDSMTRLGTAAFDWAKGLNPTAKEPRTWFYGAQRALEGFISRLTSEEMHTNVIVITHVTDVELSDGQIKGFPSTIGKALSKSISTYFNTLLQAETSGQGDKLKRTIRTVSSPSVDLKLPGPLEVGARLPLETGLATVFDALKHGAHNG